MRCFYPILTLSLIMLLNSLKADLIDSWRWLDFDTHMNLNQYPTLLETTQRVVGISGKELYDFFKYLYEKQQNRPLQVLSVPRIPKIIHFIWLGSPLPEELRYYIDSWLEKHPGWRYKIWRDEDIAKFPLYNRELYEASTNYGQKADIARCEILYHLGGVYSDVDTECLRSVEVLHYLFDFYIGIQPLDAHFLQLGTGVIGSVAKHPLLKEIIVSMHENAKRTKGAPAKTGPIHVTKVFFAHAGTYDQYNDIALPPAYIYPLGAYGKTIDRENWIKNGAFTVHHWAKTWMPATYRKPEFRKINNELSTKDWNA